MSQRSVIGIVAVLVIAVAAYAAFVLSPGINTIGLAPGAHTVAPPLKNPLGDAVDPNDPGEQHFAQGRYPEAIAYWTARGSQGRCERRAPPRRRIYGRQAGSCSATTRRRCSITCRRRSAGNAMSMFDIGSIYEYGYGVPKDIAQAAQWYGYSANYGLAQGQYNFATMLEAGEGVAEGRGRGLQVLHPGGARRLHRRALRQPEPAHRSQRAAADATARTAVESAAARRRTRAGGHLQKDATGPLKVE